MNKQQYIIAIVLLAVVVGLVTLDVLYNPNLYRTNPEAEITFVEGGITGEENVNGGISGNASNSPLNQNANVAKKKFVTEKILEDAGIQNVRIEEGKKGKDLFGMRLEDLDVDIIKKYIYTDNFPLGYVYEIEEGTTYQDLKAQVEKNVLNSPVWSINETNTFGRHSFYLNNANRTSTVFLLIEFPTAMIGFEYPKTNHLQFESIYTTLSTIYY